LIWEIVAKALPETLVEPEIEIADDEPEEESVIEPFPVEIFPPVVREMVKRGAEAIGVHVNLPAMAALGTIAASIGRGLYAQSGPSQTIRGNLFVVASAISGEGKTEGSAPLVRPFIQKNLSQIAYFNEQVYPDYVSKRRLALKEQSFIESILWGSKSKKTAAFDPKKLRERHRELSVLSPN
jgi:hypothetical protein